ncbi:MAG: hypothetical protein H6713_30835 [Myxococcales bacterium]|nr:hypothetical protein [Myxococcales bacterium]MCB9754361.1 hypothetical protein [Myxococcales bacterium]
MRTSQLPVLALAPLSLLSLAACPTPPATTDLSTSEGDDASSSTVGTTAAETSTTGDGSTTAGTTAAPTSTGASETTTATTGPADTCGDGVLDDGEACDDGPGNSETGACTPECQAATCGDGYVWSGQELCDDGPDNGEYGYCLADCSGPGPRCGDGVLDADYDEQCDLLPLNPQKDGCNPKSCTIAQSCAELAASLPEELKISGAYPIWPDGQDAALGQGVWCDMEGGWTFLKYDTGGGVHPASEAEALCDALGLTLFWPQTQAHLQAAIGVAVNPEILPIGGGDTADDIGYLGMLAIYPATPGESCVGAPLNAADCPEWEAPGEREYFVGDVGQMGQPAINNCAGCSMEYIFDADAQQIVNYFAFLNNGIGATRSNWLCRARP